MNQSLNRETLLQEGRTTSRLLVLASLSILLAALFSKPPPARAPLAELESIQALEGSKDLWPKVARILEQREQVPGSDLPSSVAYEPGKPEPTQNLVLDGTKWALFGRFEDRLHALRASADDVRFEPGGRGSNLQAFFTFWDSLTVPHVLIVPGELASQVVVLHREANGAPPDTFAWQTADTEAGRSFDLRLEGLSTEDRPLVVKALGDDYNVGFQAEIFESFQEAGTGRRRDSTSNIILPCKIAHSREVFAVQDLVISGSGLPLSSGRSGDVFHHLAELPEEYHSIPLTSLHTILQQRLRDSSGSIQLAGIRVPLDSVASAGTLLVVWLQLLFWLQLRHWRNHAEPGQLVEGIAWLGAYRELASRASFACGVFALPCLALAATTLFLPAPGSPWQHVVGRCALVLGILIGGLSWRQWRRLFTLGSEAGIAA